jgi:acyl-CoA synthetase (AMP-forming)/AMP-acid ligase II
VLNVGGCVVFPDGIEIQSEPDFIRRARVTRIKCAPVHLHWLCGIAGEGMLLPDLRVLEVGGSTVTARLRDRVMEKVSRNVYVSYSATETGVVTVAPPELSVPDTVGSALPGVHLQIVDAADKPLPRGEVGIVRVRAPGTVAAYHDDDEATAKAFRGGWFYPGDLGMLAADEQLTFKGRADDMMIFDGINIYPAEIETVLAKHEAVEEAAAFSLSSEAHQDVPVAAVTLRRPSTEPELLDFCRSLLGLRAPQRILVVEAFPRNAAGKPLKRELANVLARELIG